MGLRHDIVGTVIGPWQRTWTSTDSLLYAVGVGAGQADPLAELSFSTENTSGIAQQAIPSQAIVLAQFGAPPSNHLDGVDFTQLLHAEQSITITRPFPIAGTVDLRAEVTGLYDKGKGALVETTTVAADPVNGDEVYRTRTSVFIRGEGGWGGDRGPNVPSSIPQTPPEAEFAFTTAANQALIYRLSGDRNPLHSDPSFAAAGGFQRPILHGLASYGISVRLLVNGVLGGDASRVSHVDGRFTKPVTPGDTLAVRAWPIASGAAFQTVNGAGEVVIDRGIFQYR